MKFQLSRKYNIKARIKDNPQYEMAEFTILDADTAEEAERALKEWAERYFTELKEGYDSKKTSDQKFEEGLDEDIKEGRV